MTGEPLPDSLAQARKEEVAPAVEVQTRGACTTPDEVYVGVLATRVQAAALGMAP